MMAVLTPAAREAWNRFLANRDNCGHAERELIGRNPEAHAEACLASARRTVARLRADLPDLAPRLVVEIGCSVGFNCLALREAWPEAVVIGIEPEAAALDVARLMIDDERLRFVRGCGEALPFCTGGADLVLCHTVIEHVQDVGKVIAEMSRVLAPGGALHLEAPNYRWPKEPHLGVWCIPMLGKRAVAWCARMQGKSSLIPFLDHLQFVTPDQLEKLFRFHNLEWRNRAADKMQQLAAGQTEALAYRRLARWLGRISKVGMLDLAIRVAIATGLYPSLLYTVRRPPHSSFGVRET